MQALKQTKIFLILILMIFIQGSTFEINPTKNAVWHNEKGLFFLRFGNYYGAIEEFKIAIALNNNSQASAAFYHNLGKAYYKLGVYEVSSECFHKAINFNPNFLQYYQSLIESCEAQKITNKMLQKYQQIIDKEPYNSRTYLMLGLIHKKLGNKNKAIMYLSEFKRLEPDLDVTKQVDSMLRQLRAN